MTKFNVTITVGLKESMLDPEAMALKNAVKNLGYETGSVKTARVALRFCDEKGNATAGANPNGAAENITGILSAQGNVCAMIPNPERASEALLGPVDGKKDL